MTSEDVLTLMFAVGLIAWLLMLAVSAWVIETRNLTVNALTFDRERWRLRALLAERQLKLLTPSDDEIDNLFDSEGNLILREVIE